MKIGKFFRRSLEKETKDPFPKFKVSSDSTMQLNYYERQADSSYEKVFALSREQRMHPLARIQQLKFSNSHVHYLVTGPNDGRSLYKSRSKSEGQLRDSINQVLDFSIVK